MTIPLGGTRVPSQSYDKAEIEMPPQSGGFAINWPGSPARSFAVPSILDYGLSPRTWGCLASGGAVSCMLPWPTQVSVEDDRHGRPKTCIAPRRRSRRLS